jgi:hypothetical protein
MMKRFLWLLILILVLAACGGDGLEVGQDAPQDLALTSSVFEEGAPIPVRHTCDGEDVSPPLSWSEPPAGTESLALIMDDPDAPMGTWVHWVVFDLPPGTRSLPEAVAPGEALVGGGAQGQNSWNEASYGGPCPPPGSEHTYVFKLHALDARLDLDSNADKGEVEGAMAGHILAQGQLTGRYGR